MSTAVATAVEIVHFAPESSRALTLFEALRAGAAAAGLDVHMTATYRGSAPWLLLWGPGAPARAAVLKRHVEAGGRAWVWDLSYWDRDRKARVSVDAPHPQAVVMQRSEPASRFHADRVAVAEAWNQKGPIVIAGIGEKARVQYGATVVDRWEAEMIRACRERWPNRKLQYRRKKPLAPMPAGIAQAPMLPIDQALTGASLVVTWHSNVAVDAIRMGIPAICRDGAAAAVCPSMLGAADPTPLPVELRDRFLANLAWFQWAPSEAPAFWQWVQEVLL